MFVYLIVVVEEVSVPQDKEPIPIFWAVQVQLADKRIIIHIVSNDQNCFSPHQSGSDHFSLPLQKNPSDPAV